MLTLIEPIARSSVIASSEPPPTSSYSVAWSSSTLAAPADTNELGGEGRERIFAPAALGGEPTLGDGELPGGRGRGRRLGQRYVEAQPVVGGLVQERRGDPHERLTRAHLHERLHRGRHGLAAAQVAVGGERGGPFVDAGDPQPRHAAGRSRASSTATSVGSDTSTSSAGGA